MCVPPKLLRKPATSYIIRSSIDYKKAIHRRGYGGVRYFALLYGTSTSSADLSTGIQRFVLLRFPLGTTAADHPFQSQQYRRCFTKLPPSYDAYFLPPSLISIDLEATIITADMAAARKPSFSRDSIAAIVSPPGLQT